MRERARLLGGRVTIHGETGRGTVVRARVPLARPAEAHAEPPGA